MLVASNEEITLLKNQLRQLKKDLKIEQVRASHLEQDLLHAIDLLVCRRKKSFLDQKNIEVLSI